MSLLKTAIRSQMGRAVLASATKTFSTTTNSTQVEKLRTVIEEYRIENYQQELPSRMQKEVIKAADINNDGKVSVEELEILLKNIGAEHKFTHSEIEEIVSDMGSEDGETIHCDTMLKLLKGL